MLLEPEVSEPGPGHARLLGNPRGRGFEASPTSLIGLALNDEVLTPAEREDLSLVASLLGLDEVLDELLRAAEASNHMPPMIRDRRHEFTGKSVCFTGESTCSVAGKPMDRATQRLLAAKAGLVVAPRVTKKLDLLVLADPDSLSGKAKNAAKYGIRRIAERSFWMALGVAVD